MNLVYLVIAIVIAQADVVSPTPIFLVFHTRTPCPRHANLTRITRLLPRPGPRPRRTPNASTFALDARTGRSASFPLSSLLPQRRLLQGGATAPALKSGGDDEVAIPPRFEGVRDKGQVVTEFEVAAVRRLKKSPGCPGSTCSAKESTKEWKGSHSDVDLQEITCDFFETHGGTTVSS